MFVGLPRQPRWPWLYHRLSGWLVVVVEATWPVGSSSAWSWRQRRMGDAWMCLFWLLERWPRNELMSMPPGIDRHAPWGAT